MFEYFMSFFKESSRNLAGNGRKVDGCSPADYWVCKNGAWFHKFNTGRSDYAAERRCVFCDVGILLRIKLYLWLDQHELYIIILRQMKVMFVWLILNSHFNFEISEIFQMSKRLVGQTVLKNFDFLAVC